MSEMPSTLRCSKSAEREREREREGERERDGALIQWLPSLSRDLRHHSPLAGLQSDRSLRLPGSFLVNRSRVGSGNQSIQSPLDRLTPGLWL
jgi:hypothetical protein